MPSHGRPSPGVCSPGRSIAKPNAQRPIRTSPFSATECILTHQLFSYARGFPPESGAHDIINRCAIFACLIIRTLDTYMVADLHLSISESRSSRRSGESAWHRSRSRGCAPKKVRWGSPQIQPLNAELIDLASSFYQASLPLLLVLRVS